MVFLPSSDVASREAPGERGDDATTPATTTHTSLPDTHEMQSRLDSPNFAATPSPDQYLMERAREAAIKARKEEQEYVKFLFYHVVFARLFWRLIVGGVLWCRAPLLPPPLSAWLHKPTYGKATKHI